MSDFLFSEIQQLKDAPFTPSGITKAELLDYVDRIQEASTYDLLENVKRHLETMPDDQLFTCLEDVFGELDELEDAFFSNDEEEYE